MKSRKLSDEDLRAFHALRGEIVRLRNVLFAFETAYKAWGEDVKVRYKLKGQLEVDPNTGEIRKRG